MILSPFLQCTDSDMSAAFRGFEKGGRYPSSFAVPACVCVCECVLTYISAGANVEEERWMDRCFKLRERVLQGNSDENILLFNV